MDTIRIILTARNVYNFVYFLANSRYSPIRLIFNTHVSPATGFNITYFSTIKRYVIISVGLLIKRILS